MKRAIGQHYPGESLNPLNDVSNVSSVDIYPTLESVNKKVDDLAKLWSQGKMEQSLVRYIPGLTKPARQGQIARIEDQLIYADQAYTDKKMLQFSLRLPTNAYTNFSTMELVLPVYFAKKSNKATAIDATTCTVNNFFTHWIKEIDVTRNNDTYKILPTNNITPLYDHAGKILKYMPTAALNTIKASLLYDKTKVYTPVADTDRRSITDTDIVKRSDVNLRKRLTVYTPNFLKTNRYYRIPLKFFTELGNVNTQQSINVNFEFTLETNIMKLFETNKVEANTDAGKAKIDDEPDAQIYFHARPYITYNVIQLDSNFQQYFDTALKKSSALRQGVFLNPYRQNFEIAKGSQTQIVRFDNMPTQIEWLEISLVPEKSYQHLTMYDSYDFEEAAQRIGNIKLNNVNQVYDSYTTEKFDLTDEDDKMKIYKNFVAYVTNGCSTSSLVDYRNNDIFKELPKYETYFTNTSDGRVYIDLRRSRGYTNELEKLIRNDSGVSLTVNLKKPAPFKMRLFVTTFSQAEWYYANGIKGKAMTLKPYTVIPKTA